MLFISGPSKLQQLHNIKFINVVIKYGCNITKYKTYLPVILHNIVILRNITRNIQYRTSMLGSGLKFRRMGPLVRIKFISNDMLG